MSIVLAFFNEQTYQRELLPSLNNADYYYTLEANQFWLEEDVRLHLEVLDRVWRICPGESYHLFYRKGGNELPVMEAHALVDGEEFKILTVDGYELSLMVHIREHTLQPFAKLALGKKDRITIGIGENCDIRYIQGKRIMEIHAMVTDRGQGPIIVNLGENGVYLNGTIVRGTNPLAFGDVIDVFSLRLVYLGNVVAVEVSGGAMMKRKSLVFHDSSPVNWFYRERSEGTQQRLYRRSPRTMEPVDTGTITIEAPPEPAKDKKQTLFQIMGNSVLMVIPMMVGCFMMIAANRQSGSSSGLFMYSGLAMAGASAIVGVVWGLTNARTQKEQAKADENHRFEAYGKYLIKKSDDIREHYEQNREILYRMHPSERDCLRYSRVQGQLWNRNSTQGDFLKIRMGIGDMPFQMEISIPQEKFTLVEDALRSKPEWIKKNFETLYEVPLLLDLAEHPLVALIGGEEKFGAYVLMRTMVLQLAATHCYTDLKMAFLYDDAVEGDNWEFAKWLPHVWAEDRKIRYVGGNAQEISDICYELGSIFHERMDSSSSSENRDTLLPYFVIFLSDASLIEGEMLSPYIYKYAGNVGVSTVILSDVREELPNVCNYFLYNDEEFHGVATEGERTDIKFDEITVSELESFARRISGIRVKETSKGGELPSSVTFMEMYGAGTLAELGVASRWLKNRTYDNVRGLLGVRGGGEVQILDLHEKYHGPHGLVAGTTGSGKSETLQTYLLSLAVEFSPDDISFFVIDYKGGGMANLFNGLPHLSGSISNLSGAQIQRAMVSIKSENRRRQQLFNEARVNNINKYTRLYKDGEVDTPIPHLFIIIDEFAELKREEPDFMRELISVAQVGRSLGVHLILATQKPSGTVDENIWSNSKFRICLRVQTKEDSMDMLGKPDAAYLTQAGRGYLQVGSDEVYDLFQSGYSGAVYDPDSEAETEGTLLLTRTGRIDLRYGKPREKKTKKQEITQLDAIKEYLGQVAEREGYAAAHQLWMPILRNPIYLEEFEEYTSRAADDHGWKTDEEQMRLAWDLTVVVGQTDNPRKQEQLPLQISFASGGSHAVIGSIVSGKSTLLQTIVYSLVTTYSPKYLNLYLIDYSSHMLSAFEEADHVGSVMYEGEDEKIGRFFKMIMDILQDRKKRFRGGNYSQYVRANGVNDPAIVIVIDNFAAFNEKTSEEYVSDLITLSKEGQSNGIYLLLSAGGYGAKEIPNRLAENIGTALCLAMQDKFAYGEALHLLKVDVMPETELRGRGLCVTPDGVLEYQAALSLPAEDDYQRMESIHQRVLQLKEFWDGPRARQVPQIPENPTWESFAKMQEVQDALKSDRYLPIGYRQDNAEIYSLDLYKIYCFLVAGHKRSGKTSLMRLLIEAALMKENDGVCLIDGSAKLRDLYRVEGLQVIQTGEELYTYCVDQLTPPFKERNKRKHELLEQGYVEEEYFEYITDVKPIFIFISDMVWFVRTVYENSHDMKGFMETIIKKGELHKIYFFGALSLDERSQAAGYEVFGAFTGYRTGLHLGGNVAQDPYMSFEYMSYSEQMKTEKPGIAQIPDSGAGDGVEKVVLPLAARRRPPKKPAGEAAAQPQAASAQEDDDLHLESSADLTKETKEASVQSPSEAQEAEAKTPSSTQEAATQTPSQPEIHLGKRVDLSEQAGVGKMGSAGTVFTDGVDPQESPMHAMLLENVNKAGNRGLGGSVLSHLVMETPVIKTPVIGEGVSGAAPETAEAKKKTGTAEDNGAEQGTETAEAAEAEQQPESEERTGTETEDEADQTGGREE